MKNSKSFSLLLSLLTACGYQWQPHSLEGDRPTISVPLISGDEEGLLTAEMVFALNTSGLATVSADGGDYTLQIAVVGEENEKIGFRMDLQKVDGKVKKNLLSTEGRKILTIEMVLSQGEEIVRGPYRISAGAEYDYVDGDSIEDLTFVNPEGQTVTVLPFSLGQLESVESAQAAAMQPLYRRLARKVVDALSSHF